MSKKTENETLLEEFNKSLDELKGAGMTNIKQKASNTLLAAKNLFESQSRINAALSELVMDGFKHRTELQNQINQLNQVIFNQAV